MNIIVDTCIWSLALRRAVLNQEKTSHQLRELILEKRVVMLGAIRQELLSGIIHKEQFEKLKTYLHAFSDFALLQEDYEIAADFFNVCRSKGIQGSNTDFLICAAASRHHMSIFTNDNDFKIFSKILPIKLI